MYVPGLWILSIHFREDKTKSILFSTKYRKKNVGTLEMDRGDININITRR